MARTVEHLRCPRCGGEAIATDRQQVVRYDLGASGPGVLLHVGFFLLVALGVALFGYAGGYTELAAIFGGIAAALTLAGLVLLHRGYRSEERQWQRCTGCGHEWTGPAVEPHTRRTGGRPTR